MNVESQLGDVNQPGVPPEGVANATEQEGETGAGQAITDSSTPSTEGGEAIANPKSETEESSGTIPESLEAHLGSEDSGANLLKKKKHLPYTEGDIDFESMTIYSPNIRDEIFTIFGDEHNLPQLHIFKKILDSKEAKADAIAQVVGFEDGHAMQSAIKKYSKAQRSGASEEELMEILETRFPQWTYDENIDLPFTFSEKAEQSDLEYRGKAITWSKNDLNTAINDYVNDSSLTKKDILKSTQLMKSLQELSGLSRNGKKLSAKEALGMAIKISGVEPTKPGKQESFALGGGGNVRQPKGAGGKGISPAMAAYLKRKNKVKDFQNFNS